MYRRVHFVLSARGGPASQPVQSGPQHSTDLSLRTSPPPSLIASLPIQLPTSAYLRLPPFSERNLLQVCGNCGWKCRRYDGSTDGRSPVRSDSCTCPDRFAGRGPHRRRAGVAARAGVGVGRSFGDVCRGSGGRGGDVGQLLGSDHHARIQRTGVLSAFVWSRCGYFGFGGVVGFDVAVLPSSRRAEDCLIGDCSQNELKVYVIRRTWYVPVPVPGMHEREEGGKEKAGLGGRALICFAVF